jgi:hypothetical protein
MIVAVVALSLALVGTAVAAPDALTRAVSKSKVKKISKKQANKQINKKAAGLSVLEAQTANPVGPAGGDLTGEYPDPLIGEQKVTEGKIADAAVTTNKIADAAVTEGKIADAAVTNPKIAANAVSAANINDSSVGSRQLAGTVQVTNSVAIAANNNGVVAVACPAGTEVINGGATSTSFLVRLVSSFQAGNGWIAAARNDTGANQTLTVVARCLVNAG